MHHKPLIVSSAVAAAALAAAGGTAIHHRTHPSDTGRARYRDALDVDLQLPDELESAAPVTP